MKRSFCAIEDDVDANTIDMVEEGDDANKRIKRVDVALSDSQRRIVEAALEGQSFFFTGAAGTGKSYVIQTLEPLLREKHGDTVYITASTGVAACNIGGVTLHSFAGVGLGDDSAINLLLKLQNGRDPTSKGAKSRWVNANVLIIEECSMISAELFEKLDFIARNLRKDSKSVPFGGIQVILCGDFFQLPPVKKDANKKLRTILHKTPIVVKSVVPADFIFETKTWRELVGDRVYVLNEIYRQKDTELLTLLHDVRIGQISKEAKAIFTGCKTKTALLDSTLPDDTVKLFSTRKDVDAVNEYNLFGLEGECKTFKAVDKGDAMVVKKLEDHWMAQKILDLKIGTSVMFIKNDCASKIVNGTTGKVIGFIEKNKGHFVPEVRIAGSDRTIVVSPQKWEVKIGKKVIATRYQIPLILSYAITIHKAQGLGIAHLEVNTQKIFEHGQLYTALSRATSLEGLYIRGPMPSLISPNPKVLTWWQSISQ